MKNNDIYKKTIFENEFMPLLKKMANLNDNENYDELRTEIPELKNYLDFIISHSKDKLKEIGLSQETIEKINNEIVNFFERFINCFNNDLDLFLYLFEQVNQLYRTRIYQLNHFNGYFVEDLNTHLDEKPIFKCILFLNLFLDYYESFALFLKPFLSKLRETKLTKALKIRPRYDFKSSEIYQYLFPSVFEIGEYSYIFDYNLRNQTAHNNYLVNPEDYSFTHYRRQIFFPKLVKGKGKEKIQTLYEKKDKLKSKDIERKYKMISNLVVWFTTYFDIKINEIMEKSSACLIEANWSNYFEEYVKSWEVYHQHVWNSQSKTEEDL